MTSAMPESPDELYRLHLGRHDGHIASLQNRRDRLGQWRVGVALSGLALLIIVFAVDWAPAWILIFPMAGLVVLSVAVAMTVPLSLN